MKIGPNHLKRYKDVALLFLRHGNSELARKGDLQVSDETSEKSGPEHLAEDLENLGPTFVKIGQLLSTRSDLVSPAYMKALSRLQDDVEPVPYEEIEKVVQEQLGVRISKAFESFNQTPVGAASLGQVHRATLRSGREVAVKVQRPGIREEIVTDLDSLQEIAEFLDAHTDFGKKYEVGRILDEFRVSLMRELDYQKEAKNLRELKENLSEFHRLQIPEVIDEYCSSFVLTMDYLSGTKVTSLSGSVLSDIDGASLADELFRAYLQQFFVDGFFHADPHPGNLLLTPDHRIAILDVGMVGRINQNLRDHLVHFLAGISHGDGAQTAEAAIKIGEPREDTIDRTGFANRIEELVGEAHGTKLEKMEVGGVVLLVMQACAESGIRIPAEINLLGKTLMNLDQVATTLCPSFDPAASVRRNLESISSARLREAFSMATLMGVLKETKDFLGTMPRRTNEILDLVSNNRIRVKVDAIDEDNLMLGLQKIANRITVGLILAALIIGSAMLANIESSFEIMGYPGIALIFFLMAAFGAVVMMVQILFKDK